MQQILQSFLRRLTNLSGNNRSLLLMRLISDQFVDLHDFDFTLGNPSFKIIEDLIQNRKQITLCDAMDSRDAHSNKLAQRLSKLLRIEKFIFEERGSRDLYIGWPFIKGKFADNTPVRCPLIFFPVELILADSKWIISPRTEVNVTLNKSFLLAYAYYNQVQPDDYLIDKVLNDFDKDSTVFRTQIYELLKESSLEINFNQENYLDKLTPFQNYRRAQLEKEESIGKLKMYPEAVLGIFPQSGSYLVPDYISLMNEESSIDLEDFFSKRKSEEDKKEVTRFSDQVMEETTFTPFELDAYQEDALLQVKKGNSLVVQGPPGTGKSQLIANLISDFTARGKNVLLVCQKKAALDVVYNRLREKEVHDFIGLVHDFKSDRKSIFEKIDTQIERIDLYRKKNSGLDSIQLERNFSQSSRRIEQIIEELDEYKFALFDDSESGKCVKELYLTSNLNAPSINLKQEYNFFHYSSPEDFRVKLNRYFVYKDLFENKNSFWNNQLSFSKFNSDDYIRIRDTIDEAVSKFQELKMSSKEFLLHALDYEDTDFFIRKKNELELFIANLDNEVAHKNFKQFLNIPIDESDQWIIEMENKVMRSFKGEGMEITLKSDALGRFQVALEGAIKASRNIFSRIKWSLFSKDKVFIARVLVANELKSNKEGFNSLLARIDSRLNFEHNLSEITNKSWLVDFPKEINKLEIQNWFFYKRLALKALQLYHELRDINSYISVKNSDRKSLVNQLKKLVKLIDKIPEHKIHWNYYLTDHQIKEFLSGRADSEQIKKELENDFENLVDYHSLKENFLSYEMNAISKLEDADLNIEDKIKCFENSLALAWIDHIESKFPILRTVSSLKFDQNIKELSKAIEQKRSISQEILLLKSREKTYENLEFNRLNNRVSYRDLKHQVTKKKKIWPLRKVISEYKEELFRLIPCWMTSPESASAIFPMEELFDLVIFDEASQCFAERGIPSMYRGKQVVIAGDSKQLKPFDLYRVRWEEEAGDDLPELEIDSLLDLSQRYLKQVNLEGHYRSKALELIEFSNYHFYNGKLKVLPHRENINKDSPAINYEKVEGIWENNINEIEARKVIHLIEKISEKHPEKEIGVVTFNSLQQDYILDLLDEKSGIWKTFPKNIFVKNIENVQGDERDIIIFSTAYAPDINGKLQLKFGPLNLAGGENRLNVAITRAREEIYIVTSLVPGQLDTSKSKNEGPKVLKAYLEYAWNISSGKWKPKIVEDKQYFTDWYLKNKLKKKYNLIVDGMKLNDSLPFSDLAISKNGKYLGLIITDDENFYDALTIKQTFVYQPEHFISKNWPFVQIKSREIWSKPTEVYSNLQQFLNRVNE